MFCGVPARTLGYFSPLFIALKKHQGDICCTEDFLGRDIGGPSVPLIFKDTFNVF